MENFNLSENKVALKIEDIEKRPNMYLGDNLKLVNLESYLRGYIDGLCESSNEEAIEGDSLLTCFSYWLSIKAQEKSAMLWPRLICDNFLKDKDKDKDKDEFCLFFELFNEFKLVLSDKNIKTLEGEYESFLHGYLEQD